MAELNSRLVAATRAREAAEAALVRAEVQAARTEQRAEQQAARHEERLTELHSVIAELGRQLERHRATVIAEEDESGKRRKTDSVNLLLWARSGTETIGSLARSAGVPSFDRDLWLVVLSLSLFSQAFRNSTIPARRPAGASFPDVPTPESGADAVLCAAVSSVYCLPRILRGTLTSYQSRHRRLFAAVDNIC